MHPLLAIASAVGAPEGRYAEVYIAPAPAIDGQAGVFVRGSDCLILAAELWASRTPREARLALAWCLAEGEEEAALVDHPELDEALSRGGPPSLHQGPDGEIIDPVEVLAHELLHWAGEETEEGARARQKEVAARLRALPEWPEIEAELRRTADNCLFWPEINRPDWTQCGAPEPRSRLRWKWAVEYQVWRRREGDRWGTYDRVYREGWLEMSTANKPGYGPGHNKYALGWAVEKIIRELDGPAAVRHGFDLRFGKFVPAGGPLAGRTVFIEAVEGLDDLSVDERIELGLGGARLLAEDPRLGESIPALEVTRATGMLPAPVRLLEGPEESDN